MLRTKSGLPKHCSWNTDRHGKRRVRFRKAGFTTYLTGIPWSDNFMRQYASALEGVQAQASNVGIGRTKPGSFNALCVSYYRSPEFRGLKLSTQVVRRNIIERFRNEHGDKPVARLGRAHIKDIIGDKADTPEAANNLLKVLRVLLSYGIEIGMIASNPAIGIKRYKSRGEGFHTWSEAEVAQFEAAHPVGTTARLTLTLALHTAQRVSDLVRMGWQHVKGDRIAVRQQKTDKPLLIKMHPELLRVLNSVPKDNLTFLITERGGPFTPASLSNWFGKRCCEAGLRHCSAHGLRKLAATRLANAGASIDQIKARTGHQTTKEVERYTRAADQARLDEQALEVQLRAEREQNFVQPGIRLDKKGA
jgi:integrase